MDYVHDIVKTPYTIVFEIFNDEEKGHDFFEEQHSIWLQNNRVVNTYNLSRLKKIKNLRLPKNDKKIFIEKNEKIKKVKKVKVKTNE